MFQLFYPYEYIESVFAIDYQKLYNKGYRGIIFDLDMTLVPHGAGSNSDVDNLFRKISDIGFKTVILSDNNETRIKKFLTNIECPYIAEADKPNPDGFLQAVKMMGLLPDQAVAIGDLMTVDILGSNRAGIAGILVKGITRPGDKGISKRRLFEQVMLKFYLKNRHYAHRLGDIRNEE